MTSVGAGYLAKPENPTKTPGLNADEPVVGTHTTLSRGGALGHARGAPW